MEVFAVIVAAVPPIVTEEAPDKFVPVTTKELPEHPDAGKLVMVGAGIEVTRIVNVVVAG